MLWREVSREEKRGEEEEKRKRGREVKNGLEKRYSSGQEKKMRNRLEAR